MGKFALEPNSMALQQHYLSSQIVGHYQTISGPWVCLNIPCTLVRKSAGAKPEMFSKQSVCKRRGGKHTARIQRGPRHSTHLF